MGNRNAKSGLRNAIVYLNISADEISANDDKFWAQIFSEDLSVAEDVIKQITVQEIRMLRDGSPKNFATLAYKMVERLCLATGTLCNTQSQQTAVLNAVRILMRMLPCMFEDEPWRHFMRDNSVAIPGGESLRAEPTLRYPQKRQHERDYSAYLPSRPGSRSLTPQEAHLAGKTDNNLATSKPGEHPKLVEDLLLGEQTLPDANSDKSDPRKENSTAAGEQQEPTTAHQRNANTSGRSLMRTLILSICDLLFCPEFTVLPHGDSYLANAVDAPPEDLKSLSTYDYVWEPGVGFDSSVNSTSYYDKNRSELLRAILVCLSSTLYDTPDKSMSARNEWIEIFVSQDNRHALPLFTSLLNVTFGHKPPRSLMQLNNLLFESSRERLVELSCQLLIAALDYNPEEQQQQQQQGASKNLFIEYMSRIHRHEDFTFLAKGFIRLMNNGLEQSYLWAPARYIEVDQELQMLLWKLCNLNRKFKQFLLASNESLEIVVPILYHLNENFQETSRTALIHIGVFNLLVLSGERNFGVRLNKPYTSNLLTNLPEFSGTHADLMIIVFHKLIMYGHKINQLYDYLLTVLVNVSPYLKGTTLLACKCLIQLFETFSSVLVVFTEPNYHQLVISLLEIFNNLIQYQFDGNTNLVYMILNKKEIFINLSSLSTSQKSIDKVLRKLIKRKQRMEQALAPPEATKKTDENNNSSSDEPPGKEASLEPIKAEASEVNDNPCDEFELSSAIVSCTNNLANAGQPGKRQEVSLVATPDLHHTTQPIHPFESEVDSTSTNPVASNESNNNNNPDAVGPRINLDDILIGADCCMSEPASTIDVASLLNSGDRSDQVDQAALDCGERGEAAEECDNSSQSRSADTCDSSVGLSGSQKEEGQRWRPTSEWLRAWKQSLPLQTILRMISALEPQVEQFKKTEARNGVDEAAIIKFLQNGTLVGLLPVPHPIQIRKYRTNDRSTMWFRAYSWGIIYVRNPIWIGTDIRLIKILEGTK